MPAFEKISFSDNMPVSAHFTVSDDMKHEVTMLEIEEEFLSD